LKKNDAAPQQQTEKPNEMDFQLEELVNELGLKDLTIIRLKRELRSHAQTYAGMQAEVEKLRAELAKK
jgi:hypothetical protein